MAIRGLICDRTLEDVNRCLALAKKLDTLGPDSLTAEERSEWFTVQKGAYNFSDMNRVGSAVAELARQYIDLIPHIEAYRESYEVADDSLFHVPYTAPDVDVLPKTDWHINDHVKESDAEQYLKNLTVLRSLMPVPAHAPQVPPDMDRLTYSEANDIEKLLNVLDEELLRKVSELENWIRNTAAAWCYCSEPFCGEV